MMVRLNLICRSRIGPLLRIGCVAGPYDAMSLPVALFLQPRPD